jgi:hypothetical protein
VNAVVSSRGLAEHQAGVDSEQQQDPRNQPSNPSTLWRCNFASAPFFPIRSCQRLGARLARWERALSIRARWGSITRRAADRTEFPREVAEAALALGWRQGRGSYKRSGARENGAGLPPGL